MKKLYIGLFAAIASAISDVLLLYHPNLIRSYKDYVFLFKIDGRNNFYGWILGMLFLPLLYLGYKGIKEIADKNSRTSLNRTDWVMVFLISLGCVVHSVYHFIPVMHESNDEIRIVEMNQVKLIELLFASCYVIFCMILTQQSLKKKNVLLYTNRFFNPLFWMIFAFGIFFISPKYGGYLVVSSFNCSIAFYFVGVWINRKKTGGKIPG